jgi:hypothetical protein
MTAPLENYDELRPLLDALCEETITAEQVRRLEELVLAHPEAESFYVQYLHLHADVSQHFAVMPVSMIEALRSRLGAPGPEEGTERREAQTTESVRPRFITLSRLWMTLSAVAASVVLAWVLWPRHPHGVPRSEPTDNTVAVLLQASGAEWETGCVAPRAGAPLPPRRLSLRSGLAHIEFYSGATLILEGPAELDLISANAAFCARGKLRATVPAQAQGFTVTTPTLELVDRGTEFGVQVEPSDKTEVHVFQGKVDLYDAGSNRTAAGHKALTTGEGVHLDGPGALRAIKSDPDAFRTAKDLEVLLEEETRRRQRAWLINSEALRHDPSLLVYYTFQDDESRTLVDQRSQPAKPHNGAIIGCHWGTGRWPGKKALEFKQLCDRVRFRIDGDFESITLVAWVRVDALPNENNSLMMTDAWRPGGMHWQIGEDGKLVLGVKKPTGYTGGHYHARDAFTPNRFGQWTQLAVVYDAAEGLVTHYVDGQPAVRLPVLFDVPLHIGDAEIGNWNPATSRNKSPIRYFSGCMDEFLMFARALNDQEIERLYEQGRPPA